MIFGSALFGKLAIISSGGDTEEDKVIVEVMQLRCEFYPFLELPCHFRMFVVEVSRGYDICPRWDDELAWIGQDDEQGPRCHNRVDSG